MRSIRGQRQSLTSRLIDKLSKHKRGRVEVRRSARQDRNRHKDKAANGPHKGTAVKQRQEGVEKGVDDKRREGEGDVDEELVPALGLVVLSDVLG
jgi:hypothetical protein